MLLANTPYWRSFSTERSAGSLNTFPLITAVSGREGGGEITPLAVEADDHDESSPCGDSKKPALKRAEPIRKSQCSKHQSDFELNNLTDRHGVRNGNTRDSSGKNERKTF